MIVPEDCLAKLLEVDADVVSGYYQLRHGNDRTNFYTVAALHVKSSAPGVRNMGGGAMGCVLVDKKVLQDFSFILSSPSAPDGAFMAHCRDKKFRQVARTDVMCGHIRPDGVVLWPPLQ